MAHTSLSAAKKAKNDEFYTQYNDIEAEMNAYVEFNPDVFRGKTIDDPEWSNFTKYFAANFERFGLKKLISTSYAKSAGNQQLTLFEQESPLYDASKHDTHGKLFMLTRDKDGSGHVDGDDIEFSGYLEGDGDFRSAEVTALRDEADIIITNPPFSLFREFLAWIMEADKRFVIVGSTNAITYKEVFPLLKDNRVWLGYNEGGSRKGNSMFFVVPAGYDNQYVTADEHGKRLMQTSAKWFTNLDHGKRHQPLLLDTMAHNLKFNKKLKRKLEKDYGKLEYPHYDNYDAIEVPFTECIPSDYDGVMGVPITFMDKYDPDQFEIVAFRKGEDGKDLVFTREREREFNRTFVSLYDGDSVDDKKRRRQDKWENYISQNHGKAQIEPIDMFFPNSMAIGGCMNNPRDTAIDGKKKYARILIRKKGDASE